MPTVLSELARLQHAEAGTDAKLVDMRQESQRLQNHNQKLQREHGLEAKARKLLDKSLLAANRQNEELKKQLKAAQKAGSGHATQSDKSKNQLAQYASGLEKQLGHIQVRNKELSEVVKKRNAEVKAAAQQSMTLSASTGELSVAMTESAIALAAEQKLRKSYEAQTKELEKEARKHTRRAEEEARKSAERATTFSSELQQAQREAQALKEAVKLEQREAGRSKRSETLKDRDGKQAQKHAAGYRAEAEELRRTLVDTEAQRDAEAQLRHETTRNTAHLAKQEERAASLLEAEQKARRLSDIQLHASQKRVRELEGELRRLSASGSGDLSILLSMAPSSRRTSLASLAPIGSGAGGGDSDYGDGFEEDDDVSMVSSVLGPSGGARARKDREKRKKDREAQNRFAPKRASRRSRSSVGSVASSNGGGDRSRGGAVSASPRIGVRDVDPTARPSPRFGGADRSPVGAPPDSDEEEDGAPLDDETEEHLVEIEESTAMKAYLDGGGFPSIGAGHAEDRTEIEVKLGMTNAGETATPVDEDDMLENDLLDAQRQLTKLKLRSKQEKTGKVGLKGGGGGFLPAI